MNEEKRKHALEFNLKKIKEMDHEHKDKEDELNKLKQKFIKEIELEKKSEKYYEKEYHDEEKIAIAKEMVVIGEEIKRIVDNKQKILLLIESEILPSSSKSPFDLSLGGKKRSKKSRRSRSRRSRRR
jgi:hypothetical protein